MPPRRTPPKVVVALCAIVGGLMLDEQFSNNVVPLTLQHRYNADAGLIGLILAIHPAFGFVVQPLVGILGDRIWTPVGRRGAFLVTAAPLAALCLILMGEATSFWAYVTLLVLFQFFFAILWGSDHPLIAERVPPFQRTSVQGGMLTCGQLSSFLFVKYGVGWAMDRLGVASVYWIVAVAQIVLVAGAALFLQEERVAPVPRARLTPNRYARDLLGDPILRRFAALGFSYAVFVSTVSGFAALFAVRTLRLSKAEFGAAWGTQSLIALGCAIPLGLFVARRSKPLALVAGFVSALTACFIALRADAAHWLYPVAILFGLGILLIDVTLKPFFSDYLPHDIVGQLTGAYNTCYAAGRILAMVGTGWLVAGAHGNYRVIWIVAIVFGALAALVAATIPDRSEQWRSGGGVSEGPALADEPIKAV